MLRALIRSIARTLFRILTRLDVQGMENIPAAGPGILVANHLGRLDSPLILSLVERNDITGLVADKYQKYPLFHWILRTAKVIWLDREKADFAAFRLRKRVLCLGDALFCHKHLGKITVGGDFDVIRNTAGIRAAFPFKDRGGGRSIG